MIVIKDGLPWETDVNAILELHTEKLQQYIEKELQIEQLRLQEKAFEKSLERIFIENRLYKFIENLSSYQQVHTTIASHLEKYHSQLIRIPTSEDREKLLSIPIRRISRFDIDKNLAEITAIQKQLIEVEKELKNIKKVAIRYLQQLIKKYGQNYPRLTKLQQMEQVDTRAMETRTVKVGFDVESGFIGTKVVASKEIICTNFDKLLVLYQDGTYQVINLPEKQYIYHQCKQVLYLGIADKKTVMNLIYKELKTKTFFVKRFVIEKFIVDKSYCFMPQGCKVEFFSTENSAQITIFLKPKIRQKKGSFLFDLQTVPIKGVLAKGLKLAKQEIEKIKVAALGKVK